MKLTPTKPRALAVGLAALLFAALPASKTSALTAPIASPTPMHAAQNDALDFDLVNKTGYKIKKVLISPSASSEWDDDDDVLAGRGFNNGDTLSISFSPKTHAQHWDMKVVYAIDGSSHEWDGLNLTGISKITLHYDAGANSTSADVE
jgi:hypothetical protein